jgi:hypothetical protein
MSVRRNGESWGFLVASLVVHGALLATPFVVLPSPAPPPNGEAAPEAAAPLVGEGLDLDTESSEVSAAPAAPPPSLPYQELDPVGTPAPRQSVHSTHARGKAARSKGAAASTGSAAPAFGAVGERGTIAVTVAVTRAFPTAASGDPQWARAPLGSAGEADVRITIDASGKLVGFAVAGRPSAALSEALRRTAALLKNRTFVARGPTTTLRVGARVSADVVHDGLHGDVFAIGARMSGGEGEAFFALAMGRRIDAHVREMP